MGSLPVGQSPEDSAARSARPPAGPQIVCKPGHSIWHLAAGEAALDCDGCVWKDARNTGTLGLMNSMGWLEELECRPTCLIRKRRRLRNRENNMTQWCVLCSLWLTFAWNSTCLSYNRSLSNWAGHLSSKQKQAPNSMYFLYCFPPAAIFIWTKTRRRPVFNSKIPCLFHIIEIISPKLVPAFL